MSEDRALETITIPDIEITYGWAVSEVETLDDCDDAFAHLMASVAEIEYQIDQHNLGIVISPDPTWKARANRALKYKKAALQIIGYKRAELNLKARQDFQNKRDRALLDYIKSVTPHPQFHAWVIGSGVEAMMMKDRAA